MAAQKLTKARLIQILVMLSLLIVAFFWRTFSYTPVQSIECDSTVECVIKVDDGEITIQSEQGSTVISTPSAKWRITSSTVTAKSINEKNRWSLTTDKPNPSFILTHSNGDQVEVVLTNTSE